MKYINRMFRVNNYFFYLKNKIIYSEFATNVKTLLTGSIIAQIITMIISPFLTRIYTPESFGIFSIIIATVTILTPISTGRYEIAGLVAKNKIESNSLFEISFWSALFFLIIFISIIFIDKNLVFNLFNLSKIGNLIYLLPFLLFFSNILNSLKYFLNRNKNYKLISIVNIKFSITVAFVSIFLGLLKISEGLVISTFLATFFLIISIICKLNFFNYNNLLTKKKNLIKLAKKYKNFPLFNASTSMLDNLTMSLPILFLTKNYSLEIVGFYSLILRVAMAPFTFISQAVSEVLIKEVSDRINEKNNSLNFLLKVSLSLTLFSIIPIIIFYTYGSNIFIFFFGEKWAKAGIYLGILVPSIMVKFIVSSVSSVFSSSGNNHLAAIWKILAFLSTYLFLYIFSGKITVNYLLSQLVILDICLYLLYFSLIIYSVRNPRLF
jgi:O-antigen/teichoic acid export membrane protein